MIDNEEFDDGQEMEQGQDDQPESQQGGDDDANANDSAIQRVLDKFGGDPEKMAKAYASLQSVYGRMTNEVGTLRAEHKATMAMVERLMDKRSDEPAPDAVDPVATIEKEIEEAAARGENVVPMIMKAARAIALQAVEQGIHPVREQSREMVAEATYEAFIADYPDAEEMFPAIQRILQDAPELLPRNAGPKAMRRGLERLYKLAKLESGDGSMSDNANGPRRQPTRMDSGRTGRSVERAREATGQNNSLRQRAIETGDEMDWMAYIKQIRAKTPPTMRSGGRPE